MDHQSPREVYLHVRVGLPALQLALIVVLAWLWIAGESDAAATTIDRSFLTLVVVTPLTLAVSAWAGRALLQLTWRARPRLPRYVAAVAETATVLILVPTALLAPFGILGAVAFGPIG